MANIASYPVLDFSAGVHREKGLGSFEKNELLDARNVHINEKGRIETRLGSQQVGQTLTGTIENSFSFRRIVAGQTPTIELLVNDKSSTSVVSALKGTVLTAAAAIGDTTLTVSDTSQLTASGTLEIEGDLIAYTATPSGTSITGVTGITFAHASGAPAHQWVTLSQGASPANALLGLTYAILNNMVFWTGGVSRINYYDGTTVASVTDEPGIILLTNYHDRLYAAGDGSAGTNGDPRRVSFSNRGDGTVWTTASDFFDVEDTDGQSITGMKVFQGNLGIFKTSKIYIYNEIELRRGVGDVGAYNQKVIQELDGKIFTFCPNGIYVTNLSTAKSIGEPVREYWENFIPTYASATTNDLVCVNTFAWVSNESYFLYISNITAPTVTSDVVLEYNTMTNGWTVHSGGYTNFFHVNNFPAGIFGNMPSRVQTSRQILIGGDSGGKVWRLEENKFLGISDVATGGDIFVDLRSDTGNPISSTFETQLYDLTHPELFKKFKRLRVYTESGLWNLEYRVEDEQGISAYRTLGVVSTTNKVLNFPGEAQGWRCGFRVSCLNTVGTSVFNGFIFEDTEVAPRP